MVRDALDETSKGLLRLILGLVFHILNSGNADSNIAAWVGGTVGLFRISRGECELNRRLDTR